MNEAVPSSVAAEIRLILARHPQVHRAVLFGSRAKGNFREGSDIDLALEGEELQNADVVTMLGELDDAPIPQKVDLLLKKAICHEPLLDHIQRVGVVFYERETGQA